eukprot:3607732-Amphidinium_carterae.1
MSFVAARKRYNLEYSISNAPSTLWSEYFVVLKSELRTFGQCSQKYPCVYSPNNNYYINNSKNDKNCN